MSSVRTKRDNARLIGHPPAATAIQHVTHGEGEPEHVHLTSEPPEPAKLNMPPSPEQIIMVPEVLDERPVFSRHSVDDRVIFPTRKPSQKSGPEQYSAFFESMYSIFNKGYATMTGTKEDSKSLQIFSPRFSNYSGISAASAKSDEPAGRERDRYEAWPFIGTASQYDLDKYSEDQEESFETV
ncbi:hypothetical protein AX14_002944 [Amanita brunnescens Koide BX004]|nr:hypothetical protein AX14_002944 [Amanita brunnescens Koide BX004]